MGNNKDGNKDITEYGKATRFGSAGGPDPRAAKEKQTAAGQGNQHSVRNAARRLAAAEFDITKKLSPEDLVKKFGRDGYVVSGAQMIAIKKFQKAMTGDTKMLQQITDDIDGKQVQKVVEAQASLADLVTKSYEIDSEEQAPEE